MCDLQGALPIHRTAGRAVHHNRELSKRLLHHVGIRELAVEAFGVNASGAHGFHCSASGLLAQQLTEELFHVRLIVTHITSLIAKEEEVLEISCPFRSTLLIAQLDGA